MQERIEDYYEFMQETSHPGEEGMAQLACLPRQLYTDIVMSLYGRALRQVPCLDGEILGVCLKLCAPACGREGTSFKDDNPYPRCRCCEGWMSTFWQSWRLK